MKILKTIGIIIGSIISFVIMLILLFGILFGFGKVGNMLEKTIGVEYKNIKREQFENSDAYVHGSIDDLAKYKREYDNAETKEDKQAILNAIDDMFAEFDESKIDNSTLRRFLEDVREGNLNY